MHKNVANGTMGEIRRTRMNDMIRWIRNINRPRTERSKTHSRRMERTQIQDKFTTKANGTMVCETIRWIRKGRSKTANERKLQDNVYDESGRYDVRRWEETRTSKTHYFYDESERRVITMDTTDTMKDAQEAERSKTNFKTKANDTRLRRMWTTRWKIDKKKQRSKTR